MKTQQYIRTILTALVLLGGVSGIMAQQPYKLDPSSTMTVSGTSSMHDWEETAESITSTMVATIAGGKLTGISELTIQVQAKSLKSEKGSIMDNKTYDALKADEHPTITFRLTSITSITPAGSNYIVKGKGNLTIAGVTKPIDIMAAWGMRGEQLFCKGSYTLNMLDYNMEPPVAMMGAVKVGEMVNVKFDFVYN